MRIEQEIRISAYDIVAHTDYKDAWKESVAVKDKELAQIIMEFVNNHDHVVVDSSGWMARKNRMGDHESYNRTVIMGVISWPELP